MDKIEELIDSYANDAEIALFRFDMIGKMLNSDLIKERILLLGKSELYIYGGGILGIQLYRAVCDFVKVPAVIDKNGKLLLNIPDIPVIDPSEFQKQYHGQKIIITPIIYYEEIRKNLLKFVLKENIVFLGEFLGGIL